MNYRIPLKIALIGILTCFVSLLLLSQTTSLFRPSGPSMSVALPTISQDAPAAQPLSLGGIGSYQAPAIYLAPCTGQAETPVAMVKKDWGITNYKILLNQKYWNTTDKILCNDHWIWQSTQEVRWSDILKQLQWPADLIQTNILNQPTTVQALAVVDPATQKQQQQQVAQQQGNDAKPRSACDFVMPVLGWNFHMDACALLKTIVDSAIVKPIKDAAKNVINQANAFLWTTSPATTYDLGKNPTMAHFNALSLGLINVLLVFVVAWLAFRYLLGGGFSWLSYANLQEILPRLLFGLLAAYFAMDIAKVVIDGSNALSLLFHGDMLKAMFAANPNNTIASIVQMIYAIMGVLLVIEEGARFAVLTIILAFLPLILFLSALKETSHYAKNGIKALIFFTFLQPAQLAIMDLGQTILTHLLTKDPNNILNYLIGIAIMIVVLSLFFSVSRMAFGGFAAPLGALATGATAGIAMGAGKLGIAGAMKGRTALNQGVDKGIAAMPGLAYKAPGAAVAAYQGIRNAPQNFRATANNFGDIARKAGTKIAPFVPGANQGSKVYYTGNAASQIAGSKAATMPTPASVPTGSGSTPPKPKYTPEELARIRAYNAQYQARWKSITSPGAKP